MLWETNNWLIWLIVSVLIFDTSVFSPDQQLVENMEEEQNEHPSSGVELNAVSLNNLEQVLQNEEWVEDAT